MAEEQGWLARMVHLFCTESLNVQFEVRHHHFRLVLFFQLSYSCCKSQEDISIWAERG